MAEESRQLDTAVEPAPIRFGNGTIIEGLGGNGWAHQRRPESGALRWAAVPAQADSALSFTRALKELGIREQETISLEASELRAGADDRLTLRPAIPAGDAAPRVVLYQDESGGVSWHLATAAESPARAPRRRPAPPVFVIPLRSAPARASLRGGLPRRSLRGPLTTVGRKIFKVLIVPVLSALLGDPLRWFAEKVELRHRPEFLWQPTPDNYRRPPAANEASVDWSRLRAGPVLLLVHGIFSSVEGMLSALPRSALQSWYERYDGRLLAFNHPTVSVSPEDNARQLLQTIARQAPNEALVFDIVCHSRGGIVARTLAERGAELLPASTCRWRSVYFAATPNAGSPLGDAAHLRELIDLYSNLLTAFPDEPATYSAEVLLGLVTLAVYAITDELPGIAALGMQRGYIVDTLNRNAQRSPALYSAAAADFAAQPGRDNGWLIDRFAGVADALVDRVFTVDGKALANDLVVPTDGVFAANGHPSFPIADALRYAPADGVWHTAFFAEPRTLAHIEAHFERVRQAALARRPAFRGPPPQPPRGAGHAHDTRDAAAWRAAPGGREDTVCRELAVDFCQRLAAGASADLVVRLELPANSAPAAGRMALAFAAGSDEIELVAEVSAPGFSIAGARHATLRLLRERDASCETARFRLTALDPGSAPVERTIVVSFFRGNDCVGGVTQRTLVVPADDTHRAHDAHGSPAAHDARAAPQAAAECPAPRSTLRLARQPRQAADLVVILRRPQIGCEVFTLTLRCQIPGAEYEARDFGSFDLDGQELASYLAQALDPSFARFPDDGLSAAACDAAVAAWNEAFLTRLADLGKQLWLHLPQAFRDEYLRLMALDEPPRSLSIFADELSFPWELIRPSGTIDGRFVELPPLGSAHLLGRWLPATAARPQPQALPVARMAIVVPAASDSGLPCAADELQQLRALLPCAQPLTPATRRRLDELLRDGDAQLVHFSGHGKAGANADLAALALEGGESIPAMAFASSRLGHTRQPLLFLNACTVGRGGRVLGRAGGFAGNCIASGWSGVVAPYWPVLDAKAATFGVAFYRKLKAGYSVGEALVELRRAASDDPTALAYAYFGDPYARLLFD